MTDLELVNKALIGVGETKLPSLDNVNHNKLIDTANEFLPIVKRACLRAHDWNCARKRAALILLGAGNSNDSLGEWTYAYRLPSDCLAVRRFLGTADSTKFAPFSVELDSEDKPTLYCNISNARIAYTTELLDVNRWDALLFDACATRLSSEFAGSSPRDMKMVDGLWRFYQAKIEEAAGVNEAEGGIGRTYSNSLAGARHGNGGPDWDLGY